MKISKRLQQISALIPKASRIADIGSDHAFVPIMAVETGCSSFAIASEVAPGPLGISQQNIQAAGLSDKIQTRLGDGLAAIQVEDRIDTFIIAGMGGELIVHILAAADPALLKATHLILEPNNNEAMVRRWLDQHGFIIQQEKILLEDQHFYEMIRAQHTGANPSLTSEEQLFGPKLQQAQTADFKAKWQHRQRVNQKIVAQLKAAPQPDVVKITEMTEMTNLIERMLRK